MEVLLFISFIIVFISCLTTIHFKKLQSLINSYITSLILFFYVICFRFVVSFLPETENPPASSLNGSEWFSSFVLVSILLFSYVLGFFIAYLIKKETRTFIFVLMFSMLAVPASIFYFNIVYFIPFLIIFDFLLRKTYKYYKAETKKSTLSWVLFFKLI